MSIEEDFEKRLRARGKEIVRERTVERKARVDKYAEELGERVAENERRLQVKAAANRINESLVEPLMKGLQASLGCGTLRKNPFPGAAQGYRWLSGVIPGRGEAKIEIQISPTEIDGRLDLDCSAKFGDGVTESDVGSYSEVYRSTDGSFGIQDDNAVRAWLEEQFEKCFDPCFYFVKQDKEYL